MLNVMNDLTALDSDLARQMDRLAAQRRVLGWLRDRVEEARVHGFAVSVDVHGQRGVTLRIDWTGAEPVPEPEALCAAPVPDWARMATLEETAPPAAPAAEAAETPAQEAGSPPGDRADGGGATGCAAPVEAAYGAPWTEEEDVALVRGVALAMARGLSIRQAALGCLGLVPGRTAATVEQRVRNKLRAQVDTALANMVTPEEEAVPVPGAVGDLPPTLAAHLATLPRKRGWTAQRDLDVLHFALLNWKVAEIATELKIQADEIQPRFTLLTQNGRWKRTEVKEALEALVQGVAA